MYWDYINRCLCPDVLSWMFFEQSTIGNTFVVITFSLSKDRFYTILLPIPLSHLNLNNNNNDNNNQCSFVRDTIECEAEGHLTKSITATISLKYESRSQSYCSFSSCLIQ